MKYAALAVLALAACTDNGGTAPSTTEVVTAEAICEEMKAEMTFADAGVNTRAYSPAVEMITESGIDEAEIVRTCPDAAAAWAEYHSRG